MNEALKNGSLKEIQVSRGGPRITHFLFLDDYLFFGGANDKDVWTLKSMLQEYEACSRQCINFDKSTMFFSSNVAERVRFEVSRALGVRYSNDLECYLGFPNMIGRNKKMTFQYLKDRVKQKIDSWSTRFLSQRVREIFVKSIFQAIPMYTITCFLFLRSFCNEMESIISKF